MPRQWEDSAFLATNGSISTWAMWGLTPMLWQRTTLSELIAMFRDFSHQRGREKNYSPDRLAKSVAIEASELLELFQWKDSTDAWAIAREQDTKLQVAHEVVDILYYLLMLVDELGTFSPPPCRSSKTSDAAIHQAAT